MNHTIKLAALAIAVSLASCNDSSTTSTTTTSDSNADTKTTMSAAPAANNMTADTMNKGANMAPAGMTDQDFVTKASSMNVAEVNAHKAAGMHAMSADVKMHAKHMLTDHMKMGDEMKALASKKNMTVSMDPPAEKKQMLDDVNMKKGKDWDMAYLNAQVKDHEETIALFEDGSKSAKDADLKMLIDKSLPTLRMHLQMVKDAQAKMMK